MTSLPNRSHARRRDRHGRGMHGPIFDPAGPTHRARWQIFDDILAWDLGDLRRKLGDRLDSVDFGVLDVPGSEPAPWEDGVPLARFVPFERPAKLRGRLIFYRRPIMQAAQKEQFPREFIHALLIKHVASALNIDPEQLY